jgi:4'-phosphopantetheinyl transferase
LTPNGLDVWVWLTGRLDATAVESLRSVLSPAERSRADRFVFARDKRDYVASHALLRHVLSRDGPSAAHEWTFVADVHGKSSLVAAQAGDPPLVFNLSHTRGLVACAVARGTRIGIDVEQVDSSVNAPAIARTHFAAAEVAMLASTPAAELAARFAEVWTLKEAYVKGLGTGLWAAHPLDSFAFSFDDRTGLRCAVAAAAEAEVPVVVPWQFALAIPSPGYRMAVAIEVPQVDKGWTLTVNTLDTSAAFELLRWSGPLAFGCSPLPGAPEWCPSTGGPR